MDDLKPKQYNETSLLYADGDQDLSTSGSDSEDGTTIDVQGAKKRKRPMNVTCEACKQRKVKCDRMRPACGWCSRNDHVCQYKERKKPGLRAGYGRELESRLDRLEAALQDQVRQLAVHLEQTCSPGQSRDPTSKDSALQNLVQESPFGSSTAHFGGGHASKQSMIDPQLQSSLAPQGSSQGAAGSGAFDTIPGSAQSHHTPSGRSHALMSPHSSTMTHPSTHLTECVAPLPSYDLLYALVDLYFRHVNVWLPLLDRRSTLDVLFGTSPPAEADRVLLHAIVTVALRFSKDPRLTFESRQHYHTTSKQKVQLFGLENSCVRALQALVILALDVTGTTNGPPGWNLLALISRSVIQLGLTVEMTSSLASPTYPSIATLRAAVLPEPKSPIEDEERRRLFWGVYMLDRYATIATAFDFALDEKEVDRRLPCRDDLFSGNKQVETRWFRGRNASHYTAGVVDVHGHFSYHCELLGVLGRIHQFLKRSVDIGSMPDVEQWQGSYRALDSELNGWHFSLPDDFANITRLIRSSTPAKPVNCGWIMLHAAYCLTVIRLNSSAAYPSQTSPLFSSSYSAMQRCLSAVESMRQLSQLVMLSDLLDKLGPAFAFSAWVCARVMLVHGSTMDHEVDPDIEFFVTLLAQMGQYWAVAQRYSEILNRVLGEYRTSQGAGPGGERVTPSTVRILADMRRCAYDLDFLISRQPNNMAESYHPTRANTPAANELEYLDVFDLFNFPRIPASADHEDDGPRAGGMLGTGIDAPGPPSDLEIMHGSVAVPNFAIPNPESDWLFDPS